jgi:hypothetical protein
MVKEYLYTFFFCSLQGGKFDMRNIKILFVTSAIFSFYSVKNQCEFLVSCLFSFFFCFFFLISKGKSIILNELWVENMNMKKFQYMTTIFHCRYSKLLKKKLKYLPSRFVITLCITCGVFYEARNEGNKNKNLL